MLRCDGLVFEWKAGHGLRLPDFAAVQGSAVLLLGPSGSGKSTLLALLAGLLTPSEGVVEVAGTKLHLLPRGQRDAWRGAHLGFVPQRLHLSESLSVADNLSLPYIAAGLKVDDARIAALLQRLGLQGLAGRRPHELSVGQAQRVALARALVRHPQVVLADEPTANLDDANSAAVLNLLGEEAVAAGATLVVATHDERVRQHLHDAQVVTLKASAP
jgi:putative ABC transport system ATP-binding protein